MSDKISVAGGNGFIGSRFCGMFPYQIIKVERNQREPETNNILNFVSTTNNYAFREDILDDVNSNIVIMLEMLDKAKTKFGSDFIFNQISTWSVYGAVELPASETSECNPTGFYSITKRAAEQLLITFCEIYGARFRILRLCNIIGETAKEVTKEKNSLQYLINELKENRDITLYDNGNFLREFMYIDDACNAIQTCLRNSNYNYNEIYNIGTGEKSVYGDLIEYCKQQLKSTSKINRVKHMIPQGTVQARDIYLNVNKLKALGFIPEYTVYDALDIIMKGSKQ
jgi:nucleoside-diphosphate-sugar epimerase